MQKMGFWERAMKPIIKGKKLYCRLCMAQLWQHPNNKYLMSCPNDDGKGHTLDVRNPKYKEQKVLEISK